MGISVWSDTGDVTLDNSYNKFLENLQNSKYYEHEKNYEELKEKSKLQLENTYMLGTTIIGTKEELKKLIGNPHIKALSIGIVIDKF
ncbi:anti sigma factor C-terminal domain-containing protein [Clostridium sp. Marseille-Q7071]